MSRIKQISRKDAPRYAGFTLIEVLLAVTVAGFILGAAATMIVSVSNIWMDRQERNFFEDHVDGVTEFVQSCFVNAGVEITLPTTTPNRNGPQPENEGDSSGEDVTNETTNQDRRTITRNNKSASTSSALIGVSNNPVAWMRPPGFRESEDPLLNFKLRDQPPLLVNTDNAPALGVDAFIYFKEQEGLSLLWYSVLQEEAEDEDDLRRTMISPYVSGISYIYWDEDFEQWEEETEPQEGDGDNFILPRFIKLKFEHEGKIYERTLAIPVPSKTALIF